MTFAQDIEKAANGEPIEAVTYRPTRNSWDKVDPIGPVPWDEAREALDFAYDTGFGGSDCYPVWVWTASRVLFVGVYDGATWIEAVPRNPEPAWPDNGYDRYPTMVGGE